MADLAIELRQTAGIAPAERKRRLAQAYRLLLDLADDDTKNDAKNSATAERKAENLEA